MSFAGYFLSALFCLLSMLISDSRFDLVWFRLSCDHGWIRSGSVNVRKQQQQQQPHHEQDWQPYPVDPYSAKCNDHTSSHLSLLPTICIHAAWWAAEYAEVDPVYSRFLCFFFSIQ